MPSRDPEKRREQARRYAAKNREKMRGYQKAYRERCAADPVREAARKAAAVRRVQEYRARHKDDPRFQEMERAREARRYAKHRTKRIAKACEWQRKNAARVNANHRRWCEENRDEVRAYNREYSRAHRDPIKDAERNQRSRVGRRSGEHFTAEQWADRLEEFGHVCAYCLKPGKLTVEHVIDIDSNGSNEIDNVVPACGSCNSRKQNRGLLYMATRIAA